MFNYFPPSFDRKLFSDLLPPSETRYSPRKERSERDHPIVTPFDRPPIPMDYESVVGPDLRTDLYAWREDPTVLQPPTPPFQPIYQHQQQKDQQPRSGAHDSPPGPSERNSYRSSYPPAPVNRRESTYALMPHGNKFPEYYPQRSHSTGSGFYGEQKPRPEEQAIASSSFYNERERGNQGMVLPTLYPSSFYTQQEQHDRGRRVEERELSWRVTPAPVSRGHHLQPHPHHSRNDFRQEQPREQLSESPVSPVFASYQHDRESDHWGDTLSASRTSHTRTELPELDTRSGPPPQHYLCELFTNRRLRRYYPNSTDYSRAPITPDSISPVHPYSYYSSRHPYE
jgi:hypothetical protein